MVTPNLVDLSRKVAQGIKALEPDWGEGRRTFVGIENPHIYLNSREGVPVGLGFSARATLTYYGVSHSTVDFLAYSATRKGMRRIVRELVVVPHGDRYKVTVGGKQVSAVEEGDRFAGHEDNLHFNIIVRDGAREEEIKKIEKSPHTSQTRRDWALVV